MVTLQILVLSFLVRIQVAQLKRLSLEGRFFCFYRCWCKRVVVPTNVVAVHLSLMQASDSAHPRHSFAAPLALIPPAFFVLPDSRCLLVEPI